MLGQNLDSDEINETEIPTIPDEELDSKITEQEVRRAVFNQKNGKASGPDEISAEIIKASYEYISSFLVSIYNKLFENAQYPDSWALGYIIPVFKGRGGGIQNQQKLSWNYVK